MPELFDHPEGTSTGELEVDRLLTAPNVITTLRALCIPGFVYLLFERESRFWAAFLLGALGATDWIDGYVARKFNQSSTFGKMYDPTVDRLMMVTAIICIIIDRSAPLWFSVTILTREVVVAAWVVYTVARGAKRMNVTWWGKCGTFANMCAFPWFMFSNEQSWGSGARHLWLIFAYVVAVPGVVFSLMAAWQYFVLGRQALKEGRAQRGFV